jgi:IclR family transcriptional regulator, mhp operon transcriptional activator
LSQGVLLAGCHGIAPFAGVNGLDGIRAAAEQCQNSVESALPSFAPVIALARGLEILRVINAERQSTVGSVHKATGLDKATIVRMLETLEHEGYVMRCEEPTVYVPTGRSLLLSQGYDKYLWIGRVAEPLLNEFRKQIQWPSDIAVFDDDAMIVAHTTREAGSLLFSRRPGFRFPLLGTSMGRVYLAFVNDAERDRIVSRLADNPEPWNDLARNRRRLDKVMADIRKAGYAVMDDDYSRQVFSGTVWAFGVPVMIGPAVFASMNVMMLRKAVSREDGLRQFLAPLQRAAAGIAEALKANLDTSASLHVEDRRSAPARKRG